MSVPTARPGSVGVPFFSLDQIESAVDVADAVNRVVRSRRYVLGSEVDRFERAFAAYCGVEHCIGVANGTDALEIALRCLEIGPGARVLVVANAGYYATTAVRAIGAIPEYVEIEWPTMTMSARAVSEALEDRPIQTRPSAVIVTHLYGQLADTDAIVATASRLGIPVIEDCAQAHGATRAGTRAGAFATIGCFSFYPTKNLGAVGDGGAVVTSDAALASRARSLRQYGWGAKYHVESQGGRNSRLDEIQAAVLNDRLPHLDEWNDARRAIAGSYQERLDGLPLLLSPSRGDDFVAHLFVVRVKDRGHFREHLASKGIDSEIHYPVPDHLQPAFSTNSGSDDLPHTEAACASVLSLPCYPGLSQEDQRRVVEAATGFFATAGH